MDKGTHWWVLVLNDMRYPKIQMHVEVARGESKEVLVDWVESHRAPEMYHEENYGKTFKKGSPLEWFNPPESTEGFFASYQYAGSYNEFVTNAMALVDTNWESLENIPPIEDFSNG